MYLSVYARVYGRAALGRCVRFLWDLCVFTALNYSCGVARTMATAADQTSAGGAGGAGGAPPARPAVSLLEGRVPPAPVPSVSYSQGPFYLAATYLAGAVPPGAVPPWPWALTYSVLALLRFAACLQLASTACTIHLAMVGLRPDKPNLDAIHQSRSVSEFWGKRWDRELQFVLKGSLYAPLRAAGSSHALAVVACFVGSGALHVVPFVATGSLGVRREAMCDTASYYTLYTPFIHLYCRTPVIPVYTPYTHL